MNTKIEFTRINNDVNGNPRYAATIIGTYITKNFHAVNEKEAKAKARDWAKAIPGNYSHFRIKIQRI